MTSLARCALWVALCVAGAVQAQDAQTIFRKVSPSVVVIRVYDAAGVAYGQGSGVVVAPEEVVTNCHVIENAQSVRIIAGDSGELKAIPTRALVESDLCLLQVENLGRPVVALKPGAEVVRGERVFAIGNPLGLRLSVSEGLASAVTSLGGQPRILTSAAISPGSSGGGLFDTQGRLVGITTRTLADNVNVAVPADLIAKVRSEGEAIAPPSEPERDVEWVAIAEKLHSDRQWQALLAHAKRWLEAYPTSYFAAQTLGLAQVNVGQAAEARATLLELTKNFPRAARAFSYLAYAHRGTNELDLAEAAARRAVELLPGDGYGHSILAEIQASAGHAREAAESAQTAIRLSPALPYPWEARAGIALAAKRYADAVSDIRVVARLLPGNLQVRRKLAGMLAVAGQTGEARTIMAALGASERKDAQIWASIAFQESQSKRYGDAENAYRRAIEIDGEFAYGWRNLGLLLAQTNREREAELALRTALKIDPADNIALGVLAEITSRRGDTSEAKNLLEQATQTTSTTAREWRALGRSRLNERNYQGAAEAYAKAVELEPKSTDDWIELANIHGVLRQDTQALAAVQRAEQLDPANERLLLVLARFHGDRGNYAKALEFGERAVQKYPASADAWNTKGYSLLRLMQYKPAIESLTTATRLDPDKVAPWINLGEAHLHAGELSRAIATLERALKLAPKAVDARLFMSRAFASAGQFAIAHKYVDELLQEAPNLAAAWLMSGLLGAATRDPAATLRAYEKLKLLNPPFAAALRKEVEAKPGPALVQFPD